MDKDTLSPVPDQKSLIVEYWRALELFTPQKVPRLNETDRYEPVVSVEPSHPFPWKSPPFRSRSHAGPNAGPNSGPNPGKVWRFQVYCGIYRTKTITRLLKRTFGRDANAFDTRSDGQTCLFSFTVTADGRPLLDTFTLSSCCWAAGRTLEPGPRDPGWLNGFEEHARAESSAFSATFAAADDDDQARALLKRNIRVGRPIDFFDLADAAKRVSDSLGVAELLRPLEIRIAGREVNERFQFQVDQQDFLNSFFLRDLANVSSQVKRGHFGPALKSYLSSETEVKAQARIDLREDMSSCWAKLAPNLFPEGKWPSSAAEPLYFGQQLAVNSTWCDLSGSAGGLAAVNGPPGTGKTTILREIFAAVEVERAKRLASLARPQDAFAPQSRLWKIDGIQRPITLWRDEFLGFEVVVASNNNAAVENVTLEIPALESIGAEWQAQTSYYADFATRLLGREAWGLAAAKLGNRENCGRFRKAFWFKEANPEAPPNPANEGFLKYLQSIRTTPQHWERAKAKFQEALARENGLREERMRAWRSAGELARLEAAVAKKREALAGLEFRRDECWSQTASLESQRDELARAQRQCFERRSEHRSFKPGMTDAVFTFGKAYREWQSKDSSLQFACEQAEVKLAKVSEMLDGSRSQLRSAESELADEMEVVQTMDRQIAKERACRDEFKAKLGGAYPDPASWPDARVRELSSPWADEEWTRARTNVFVEALHLHRAFVECNARQIQRNLLRAMDLLAGKVPPGSEPQGIRSVWATLFFVVPVISTTFASFDRLFAHLKREEIGWLLIDEAAQCVPQAAAGALWRSKRAIAAGDPMQLEPISPLPPSAQYALQRYFRVSDEWVPAGTSAQRLADRASRYGTTVPHAGDGAGDLAADWVGCPLRVHRRCEHPMFDIANAIGYGGQMVYATPDGGLPDLPAGAGPASAWPASAWIDIKGTEADTHWLPAEGLAAEMLIEELLKQGAKREEIFLISPFRSVARRLAALGTRHTLGRAGTIHKAQGKESDIVILVLGGNPDRPRAKEWASEKPNLLNVAVSRARRRLYVIGNRDEWLRSSNPYFWQAAELLKAQPPLARFASSKA